jgi:hypothetical protein
MVFFRLIKTLLLHLILLSLVVVVQVLLQAVAVERVDYLLLLQHYLPLLLIQLLLVQVELVAHIQELERVVVEIIQL